MKSLQQIKLAARKGDYTAVAQIVGKSRNLIQAVIDGDRTDHHHIQQTFSDLLENRERLTQRSAKRRKKQQRIAA